MNLKQLQYFQAIAELEHYTQAAEKLYVGQSTLSHAIQELESELNVKLFTRKGRNVKLTKYGELFLPHVQKSLESLETGISILQEYNNPNSGTVTLSAFPSLAQFLPDIIVRYLSETNRVGVRFQFSQNTFYFIQEHLLSGKIDLAFATWIDDPRVEHIKLGTHPLVLLVPFGHRLARRESASLKELDQEPFINFDSTSQLHYQNREIFESLNINPTILVETPQDIVMYGLVAANQGVAITPYPLGGAPYNVKIIPISDNIPARDLYLMWCKDRYMPPAAEYFRDYIIRSGKVFDQFRARNGPSLV
ncbi:LysR family transcriptional regulator [Oscillibacter sp.]|uniref:LysR family transcriptional regulator n=1 Tax=Oscillibacter sp. TaxID=1945593 RepID=UPI00289796E1|nr:LysR family transcriptional regulator [Oscillibacter sp.]